MVTHHSWLSMRSTLLVALSSVIVHQTACAGSDALGNMSLAELMDEPVTSVSKKETKLSDSAAAITVITQADIRRLGITSVPEALRLVPGMNVAQISSNEWAVSARGFSGKFSNKLLVLVDGRTVYAPASAGVFWNTQDLMLEDIDRIEVIRGPGATLWGSNAVNGVVNISTKRATDTQGALFSGSASNEPSSQWAARYGGHIGDAVYFRGYAKYLDQAGLEDTNHGMTTGGWHTTRGGFRLDWNYSTADAVTLQGDAYSGRAVTEITAVTLAPPTVRTELAGESNSGQNVLARWAHSFTAQSESTLQAYVDHGIQGDGSSVEYRTTYDVDWEHRFHWQFNDFVWGMGYRKTLVEEESRSFQEMWNPSGRDIKLFNFYLQDEVDLIPGRLRAIAGAKFEASSLVMNSVEPTLRVMWTPAEHQALWAAISKATRTPSLFELDGRANAAAFQPAPGAPTILVSALPNPDLQSENVLAYEIGYRYTPAERLAIDVTSYLNNYIHLITLIPVDPSFESSPAPPHVLMPVMQQDIGGVRTYGVEATLHLQAADLWQITASIEWEHINATAYPIPGAGTPSRQAKLRSYLELPHALELNTFFSYVSPVTEYTGISDVVIPAYVRADLGLLWRPTPGLTLGVWGTNLLHAEHVEFASFGTTVLTEIPRSVVGKITWSF